MDDLIFISGKSISLKDAVGLLKEYELPTADLNKRSLQNFIGFKDKERLIGLVALESYETFGLLRSLVVDKNYRDRGLANKLIEQIVQLAKRRNVSEIYLLTTTAKDYFLKKGFDVVSREDVPDSVKASSEFSSVCPASADVMVRKVFA
jgi:amino-acid N-acetyltransferase